MDWVWAGRDFRSLNDFVNNKTPWLWVKSYEQASLEGTELKTSLEEFMSLGFQLFVMGYARIICPDTNVLRSLRCGCRKHTLRLRGKNTTLHLCHNESPGLCGPSGVSGDGRRGFVRISLGKRFRRGWLGVSRHLRRRSQSTSPFGSALLLTVQSRDHRYGRRDVCP